MKSLFLASVLSILLVPHFSYAETAAVAQHHRAHHATTRSKSADAQPVNINQADAAQLATLKGVGPKKAGAIVAYRTAHGPFHTVNELAKVKGIGLKAVARLESKNPGRLVVNNAEKRE